MAERKATTIDRTEGETKLTHKQRLFVNFYLGEARGNATQAARLAGYSGERTTLAEMGSENLRKPAVKAAISDRVSELAMTPEEVLARLAEHARGDMTDFIEREEWGRPVIDLGQAIDRGKGHLIKKFGISKLGIEVELYDAQAALVQLGKYHGLFKERTEITGKDGEQIVVKVLRNVSMDDL